MASYNDLSHDSDADPDYDVDAEQPNRESEVETDQPTALQIQTLSTTASTPHPTCHVIEADPVANIERSRRRKRSTAEWKQNKKSAAYKRWKDIKEKESSVKENFEIVVLANERNVETTDNEREAIHTAFWSLREQTDRANYIIAHSAKISKQGQVRELTLHRGDNVKYFLPRHNAMKLEVCKQFFLIRSVSVTKWCPTTWRGLQTVTNHIPCIHRHLTR